MKTILLFLILFALFNIGQAQDIIYKKNDTKITCKVREVTIDVIKYKRTDIKNSPVFEIKKEDIRKIKYKNGLVDIYDSGYYDQIRKDTAGYAMIYVVFNSGYSSQIFPLYVRGQFICKLENHSRLALKMFFEGKIEISRIYHKKVGPLKTLSVQHGFTYGISIDIVNEQYLDPNERFSMTVFKPLEVQDFLKNEYNGFQPYKGLDFHIVEDR